MTSVPPDAFAHAPGAPAPLPPAPRTPPGWPVFEADEIAAATAPLASGRVNYWTGDVGKRFEQAFAAWHGVPHAIALANGTLALELALLAQGVGPGDEVIVPARTFIASASAVVARGARVVVADVDRDSGVLTPATVAAALSPATRAIVAVHLAGWPVDVPAIRRACGRPIAIVEDCAQAHGARLRGTAVGALGDIAAFSFCQDKIMTTGGEGGMVTTADRNLWAKMWAYKDHGKDWDAVHRSDHPPGFRWLHASFGSNFRLTEMQSAIGLVQLGKLESWVARRRRSAAILREALADIPALRVPWPDDDITHAHYRFYGYVAPERLRDDWSRDRIVATIAAAGVPCMQGSCSEIWRERAFPESWRPAAPLPIAAELGRTAMALLVHPTLEDDDVAHAGKLVAEVLRRASR
ncbi:MAG: DegT/DnrJ/EryC1/StrS aminotransferase family protein [Nannocystaceae bacterium]|nr:DegT/DnrJ/EryC1/StrS aminotransferase family protein [Nannocystaceae bacterium]